MALDESLATRVRKKIGQRPDVVEKKMFGGVAFLINGNMSVGVHGNELIVRIPPDETDVALKAPGTRVFDLTGRPMKGWLLVGRPAIDNAAGLGRWIKRGVDYAASLPKK
jgi:TfoX/Sxy family transcriptional regulator of competence genes